MGVLALSLVFLISPKTSGKQMVVYHSEMTVLRRTNDKVATCPVFPKKQATICFVCEQLLLELAHFERPIQSTGVYFRSHTRRSTIRHILRCHRHVLKHRGRSFLPVFIGGRVSRVDNVNAF